MEFNIVYVVSERPAVVLSGPMVDLGGLSRLPTPIADCPCSQINIKGGFYLRSFCPQIRHAQGSGVLLRWKTQVPFGRSSTKPGIYTKEKRVTEVV